MASNEIITIVDVYLLRNSSVLGKSTFWPFGENKTNPVLFSVTNEKTSEDAYKFVFLCCDLRV